MSLRHHIADRHSPVRLFIDAHFAFQPLSREINKSLKKLPFSHRPYDEPYFYAIAGTAADLMIRGLFDQAIHMNHTVQSGMSTLASRGCSFSFDGGPEQPSTWGDGKWFWDKTSGPESKTVEVISEFEKFSKDHDFRKLEDQAARRLALFCILFGRVDHGRRSGNLIDLMPLGPLPLEEKLERASTPVLLDDVTSLFRSFAFRHKNATFNHATVATGKTLAGSIDVHGADFDFVVDGCLYEIKTTIKPVMSVDMMRQCVGYWLLDYDDEFSIHEIAIDLPRQDFVQRLNVRQDLLRPEFQMLSSNEIRSKFREIAKAIPKPLYWDLMPSSGIISM